MGNFEKLSVLVIVVIIVMILVVAIYTWTDNPDQSATTGGEGRETASQPEEKPGGAFSSSAFGTGADPSGAASWEEIFKKQGEPGAGEPKIEEPTLPEPKITEPGTSDPVDPAADPAGKIGDAPVKEEPAAEGPWKYVVQPGDTISQIAQDKLGTIRRQKEIFALNPGLDPLRMRAGQELTMPPRGAVSTDPVKTAGAPAPVAAGGSGRPVPGEIYETRRGDTLKSISKRAYGTIDFWPDLWSANLAALDAPEDMKAGLKLKIPPKPSYK